MRMLLYVFNLKDFLCRVRSEYFDYVYGDIALIAFSAPAVFLYMIFSMGKFNVVEHGVNILDRK